MTNEIFASTSVFSITLLVCVALVVYYLATRDIANRKERRKAASSHPLAALLGGGKKAKKPKQPRDFGMDFGMAPPWAKRDPTDIASTEEDGEAKDAQRWRQLCVAVDYAAARVTVTPNEGESNLLTSTDALERWVATKPGTAILQSKG